MNTINKNMSNAALNKEKIQEILIEFICRQFIVDISDIELDKSLIDTGIIDSIGLIEIASFIKNKYGIIVLEEHMNRSNFGSVIKIVDFIHSEIRKNE